VTLYKVTEKLYIIRRNCRPAEVKTELLFRKVANSVCRKKYVGKQNSFTY